MPDLGTDLALVREQRRIAVNAERDRRLGDDATLTFGGNVYQFGPDSRENIMGAANTATIAVTIGGAVAGDLYWHGGTDPFVFLTKDNVKIAMDAPTAIQFGRAGASLKSRIIFAARSLKDQNPIPANFADDVWWP